MTKPDWDQEADAGWYRRTVGHRLEKGVNRIIGSLLLLIAIYAGYVTLTAENFTLGDHWPGLAIAGLFLLGARYCFRARKAVFEDFDGEGEIYLPPGKREK